MKILELRFKNLNSLYGEWVIDLTNPEYISNGIFALTGPTGAGKSTILDAICLALYGATPRLGKITKSGNEIMSRQTGECYAEAVFESQSGRYRCHWEQRRAWKKANGSLQDQEHQIADAVTGTLIETRKSLVLDVIEEKTGMDFDRFTRSMLLAQGGFDTFLKADIEQKSKILEQITGTEIYSAISLRIHERRREEQEKLNVLRAEIAGIVPLKPEQRSETQNDLVQNQEQETELTRELKQTEQAITWRTTINGLKEEIQHLSEKSVELQNEINQFKPELQKLGRANRADSLFHYYQPLATLRTQQSKDQEALQERESDLNKLNKSAKEQADILKKSEKLTSTAKQELNEAAALIKNVRALDQTLAEQQNELSKHSKNCKKQKAKIEVEKQTLDHEQKTRDKAKTEQAVVEKYFIDNAQDEWLIGGLAGIEEQLSNLNALKTDITKEEADQKSAGTNLEGKNKELETERSNYAFLKQSHTDAQKQVEQEQAALNTLLGDRLLREYQTEKETLLREQAYIKKIEALKDHRAKLEDGKPCPLCGSTHHPFAEGNVPAPDQIEQNIQLLTELIKKAEKQTAHIEQLNQTVTTGQEKLYVSDNLITKLSGEMKLAEAALAKSNDCLKQLRSDFLKLQSSVVDKLQPLGITELLESHVSRLLESLKSRLRTWQKQVKEKTKIDTHIGHLDSEINRLSAVIATQQSGLEEAIENLSHLEMRYGDGKSQRENLYGDKNPDSEEDRLKNAIADAEESEKEARSLNAALQQQLTAAETLVVSLKTSITQREPELKQSEASFVHHLKEAGFVNEADFLGARLDEKTRQAISDREKQLENDRITAQTKLDDRNKQLGDETKKQISDKTLDQLNLQLAVYQESLAELADRIAILNLKLVEDDKAIDRIKEKQLIIDTQKKECARWDKLHRLVGSSDGKKYRNFAQGLTFEFMVSHANQQLEQMTDRYLLIRDDQQPLALNVIDSYQAGEIRSTKNLSGGESFIVSLTLALGLSKMASRKVRVDSLFLDEGFGTLDEEALETALDTLSRLQQDGKLIGIISHVSALKDRISTQINVMPTSGGRSTLSGPGCTIVN